MTNRYDAVIVGGGHNGLVCAAYLARAGMSVCVLERRPFVGGAAITEEFHPGFRNSSASYTVGLFAQRIFDDLKLARTGLRIVARPVANFVPSQSGRGLALHRDPARSQVEIRAHSKRDAERYPEFVAELATITRLVKQFLLEEPIDPSGGWREHLRALARLTRFRHLRARDWSALWTLLAGSAGDWLDSWFESDALKGALGFDAIVGHFASPYAESSGYLLLHHALGDLRCIDGGWGHAIGGMGAITDAIAAVAREHGAVIRCNAPVDAIEPGNGRLRVRAGGEIFEADRVAGAIHPRLLFGELVDPVWLPERFVRRIASWRSESASFRANLALAEPPAFACLDGLEPAGVLEAGILISPSLAYLEAAYRDALDDAVSREPVIELVIPSLLDPGLAPAGAHVASVFCQHFRFGLPASRQWSELREPMLARVIATIDKYAPGFGRSVIAGCALSPADLEQTFGLVGGDIFHGALTRDQLYWARPAFGYARYRTPLAGLYLCGSGAHPGGGVTGMPGHNAAAAMIADARRRRHVGKPRRYRPDWPSTRP
jgi:phytoene dehydrogenase-like protein